MLTIVFNQPATELRAPSRYANPVYGSHKDIYQDITIVSPITKGKFPLFLINSQVTKLDYAMKVFPHNNGRTPIYFKNETRFSSLRHPNIIRSLYSEEKKQAMVDGITMHVSYAIMEYALHGDFMKFMKEHSFEMTEKLVRTYFRQLIEGLEYLHNNGVAHMDLKLDNLLLSEDFTLKIGDFDMAHFSADSLIISNGSKFFRSPEVSIGKCNNPKAADIYSAGIILFSLMTRGTLPQFEKELIDGINFADLLANDIYRFWTIHSRIQKAKKVTFDDDFKELFEAMTKLNPSERASIEAIKASKWYNKPYYSSEELIRVMERIMRF